MDQHATVEDVMISILPLAHMFERIGEVNRKTLNQQLFASDYLKLSYNELFFVLN